VTVRRSHPAVVKLGEHAAGRLKERSGWKFEILKVERLLTSLLREQIKLGLRRDRHMRFPLLLSSERFGLEADLLVPLSFPDDERNVWKAATVTYRNEEWGNNMATEVCPDCRAINRIGGA